VDSNDRKNESAKLESVALEELDFATGLKHVL